MTNSVSPRSMRNAQKYSIISANNSCSTNYHRWSTKKKAWWQYYFSQLPPFKDRNPNAMEPNGMEGRVGYKWRAMSPPPLPPPPVIPQTHQEHHPLPPQTSQTKKARRIVGAEEGHGSGGIYLGLTERAGGRGVDRFRCPHERGRRRRTIEPRISPRSKRDRGFD